MRILVISRSPWRNDNNTGNTLTDFFQDFPNAEIYSLCMREQVPQNDIALRNFYISEKQLVLKLLGRTDTVGAENASKDTYKDTSHEKQLYDAAKKRGWYILYFAREILWSLGFRDNSSLKQYLDEIRPDIIFCPVFGCIYPHRVLQYIRRETAAPVVLFHADDNYTWNQFHISPLYWLYRMYLRKWVRRSVAISDINYVISDVQKEDYEKAFRQECRILTKFADFSGQFPLKGEYSTPLQLVFTGNINLDRWKTLSTIAKVLKRINRREIKAELRIYTATPITGRMRKKLHIPGCSYLMGSVSASEIPRIQSDADILVHVEAWDLKNRLAVRQSFSTKIVDYMKAARPILAVGPKEVASIRHLIQNDCAITADTEEELYEKLTAAIACPQEMDRLARSAVQCGRGFHDKETMQSMMIHDFIRLLEEEE